MSLTRALGLLALSLALISCFVTGPIPWLAVSVMLLAVADIA